MAVINSSSSSTVFNEVINSGDKNASQKLDGILTQASFPNVKYGPRRIQTLDPEYEILLKQIWSYFFKFWGYDLDIKDEEVRFKQLYAISSEVIKRHPETIVEEPKRKGGYLWGRLNPVEEAPQSERVKQIKLQKQSSDKNGNYLPITIPDQYWYTYANHYDEVSKLGSLFDDLDEEHALELHKISQEFRSNIQSEVTCKPNTSIHPSFKNHKPDYFHKTVWWSTRTDTLDNFALKIIRARRGNIDNALDMFVADLDWRGNEELNPNQILLNSDADFHINGTGKGVINNLSLEKCWVKGTDLEGNLLFFFKSDRHYAHDAPQDEMRKWLLLNVEWSRLMLKDILRDGDRVTVFFDLTGFSLKNADYATMKFVLEMFEAHQPESLAHIIVYNAPWVFQTFYGIIKGWIDPDIAQKIRFAKTKEEVSKYVRPEDMPSCMGGEDEYNGEYIKPTVEDLTPPSPKDSKYFQLVKERHLIFLKFLERTKRWIESTDPELSSLYLQDKIDLNIQMSQNYVEIDQYIRRRGMFDRNGILKVEL